MIRIDWALSFDWQALAAQASPAVVITNLTDALRRGISAYLDYLALAHNVARTAQSQVLNALAFLTKNVLGLPAGLPRQERDASLRNHRI